MSEYNQTPQSLDELEESLNEYHRLRDQYHKDIEAWIADGKDPDDEDAPQYPIGPIMTSAAMLDIIGVVLSMRRWLNGKTL